LAGTLRIRRAADGAAIPMSADCTARLELAPLSYDGAKLRLVS
jgi:hypothetical protein